jgi:T-complex protein 1 subunit theta
MPRASSDPEWLSLPCTPGMNKLVVNHLEKIIVTSDGATVVRELEVMHPAAKMIVLASQMQEQEMGDGTSFVVSIAGEMLLLAAELLRQGLHTAEILEGYKRAYAKAQEILPSLVCHTVTDVRNREQVTFAIKTCLASKQYGFEDTLAPFVAEACLTVMAPAPKKPSLAVDNVRICKLQGGSLDQCHVIKGMVILRDTEGSIKVAEKAKVTVFGCGIEASATEAKGTVLIRNADDLKNYNLSEEKHMEDIIKGIADSGAKVVICQGSISEMARHFMEKYGILSLKITSKWELRRICQALRATALVRLGPATPDEMGYCDKIEVQEVGGRNITVLEQKDADSRLATIVLRASTESLLNDVSRAVDDGVQCIKAMCDDGRFVPGGGAAELELSHQIHTFADSQTGLDQYAIAKFADALEVVPRILCETSGMDATAVLTRLHAAHEKGEVNMGVDISPEGEGLADMAQAGVIDLLATKENALRLAVDAVLTVLRVDQIIMSKPAGGPKPRAPGAPDM